ncbi:MULTISPECIES: hypothetical protein [unclassified Sphingobium]|uniref:hypothetical protein n=1 Tax=unclassified Sphingobium TaxID=2611147 RepID=UPI002224E841|nr:MULTISPECIES: hypothetical protein [unclassified Sphingobium]MCW2382250.1 hypothetical protein [Sphingobium sp. B2D3B]MCW2397577.1 hypothetical protein [Sphingobium sp. B2D3C]
MNSAKLILLIPTFSLAACGGAPTGENQTIDPSNAASPAAINAEGPTEPPAADEAGAASNRAAAPDFTPPMLTPEAERTVKGARNVLISFARAIEQRAFDQAWALLAPADKEKWSKSAFAALFADLSNIMVAMPDGTMEGAAGSSYYTAPVTITGKDRDGRPVRMEGEAVLRRVNDVDGATPAQLRWHFQSLTLDWTH